jgi:hypothetical protein
MHGGTKCGLYKAYLAALSHVWQTDYSDIRYTFVRKLTVNIRMKTRRLFLMLLLALPGSALFAQTTVDLTGTWLLTVETDAGSGTPTFVLKQDTDGKLTGTYTGQLGETELKGTVKGNEFHIEFLVQDNAIKYDGKLEKDTMSGKVELGTMAKGTFTGKRKTE